MRRVRRLLCLTLIVFFAAVPVAFSQSESSDEDGVLVGRVSYVEGELLRYVPDEEDWVATVRDAPFGLDDALYSDEKGRAEFIMPNGTWLRIDGSTQTQMIALKEDVTEVDVASGIARFHNKGSSTVIKATTPFGYVVAPSGTIFDLYVGDESVEVIALKGQVDFILESDESRYEVDSGSSSIIADSREVTSGEGTVDAEWDDWNLGRDDVWSKRLQVKGDSVKYLPEQLHDDAYELEEHGSWERVEYEGSYRNMWRPARVQADWQPFSSGRWTVYHEDNCWVPDEPFGYVTHHYGNWVFVGSHWYWSPPVVRVRVGAPVVGIGFGWYPGRVAWIHSDVNVGWVPLAPTEVYYSHRRWGRRSVVINNVNIANVNINIGGFRYANRAIVVGHNHLYGVRNYRNVRVTNINKTVIINNYRGAAVVNNTVVRNYASNRQRYNFTDVRVHRKPHHTVIGRIQRNEKISRDVQRVNAREVRRNVDRTRQGQFTRDDRIVRPKVNNRMVDAADVRKPREQVRFKERELKTKPRAKEERRSRREGRPDIVEPRRPEGRPEKVGAPAEERRKGKRDRPGRPEKPERGEAVEPGGRGEKRAPGEEGGRIRRERPERPERSERDVRPGGKRERRAPGEEPDGGMKRKRPERPRREVVPEGREDKQSPREERRRMKRERPERPEPQVRPDDRGKRRAPVEDQGKKRRERPERPERELSPGGREDRRTPDLDTGRGGRGGQERKVKEQGPVERRDTGRKMREERRRKQEEIAPVGPGKQPESKRQMREERKSKQERMAPVGAGGQQGSGRQAREERKQRQERVAPAGAAGQQESRRLMRDQRGGRAPEQQIKGGQQQQQDGERRKKKQKDRDELEQQRQ